ncbi:MAG: SRPBCC domain-containing protein [Patescibacteria group bacterium]|nr:SRPBCC domain-containing protein [Patescibacteria group bacterium]
MKTIKQTYLIKARIEKVWQALVSPKIINDWGGGPAKMDDKIGTNFSLWGGDIHGKNIKVIKNKELVQEWFSGGWEKPSQVTFKLLVKGEDTQLDLYHINVPDSDVSEIDDGWKRYYLGPLKELLETNE